jgi:peroxiredoxin
MPAAPERVLVGVEAPDFTFPGAGLSGTRLRDYRGRSHVLLVFLRGFG